MNDSVEITHWVVKFVLIYSDFNYTYAFRNHTNAILILSQEGFKSGRKPPRVKERTVLLSFFFLFSEMGREQFWKDAFEAHVRFSGSNFVLQNIPL